MDFIFGFPFLSCLLYLITESDEHFLMNFISWFRYEMSPLPVYWKFGPKLVVLFWEWCKLRRQRLVGGSRSQGMCLWRVFYLLSFLSLLPGCHEVSSSAPAQPWWSTQKQQSQGTMD
jgi:hypothetical protein